MADAFGHAATHAPQADARRGVHRQIGGSFGTRIEFASGALPVRHGDQRAAPRPQRATTACQLQPAAIATRRNLDRAVAGARVPCKDPW